MNEILTISKLYEFCKEQIKNGNGDKKIYVSSDDEGNNFHPLWFAFNCDADSVKSFAECGMIDGVTANSECADIALLG